MSSSGRCALGGSRSRETEVLFLALASGGWETSTCQSSLPYTEHSGGGEPSTLVVVVMVVVSKGLMQGQEREATARLLPAPPSALLAPWLRFRFPPWAVNS